MPEPSGMLPRYTGVLIALAMVALMVAGILAIHISEQAEGSSGYARRQMVFAGVAMATFLLFALVPYPRFGRLAYPLFGVTLVMLSVLAWARLSGHDSSLLPGIRGSHRWIDLQVFQVQPSEIAKLSQILLLAWYLRLGDHYRRLPGLIPPFVLTLVPMTLVFLEPDLGTSLLFLPTLYAMLFLAGAKLRHLLGIVAVGAILVFLPVPRTLDASMPVAEQKDRLALAYWVTGPDDGPKTVYAAAPLSLMQYHQLQRVDGWLRQGDPEVIQGKGYHLFHSKVVLGSGRVRGGGDWDEAEVYFRLLPDDHTDFIFSIIGGQWGFLGCATVLLLYGVIFVFGLEIAATTYEPFGRMLAVGVLGLLAAQIFINVGMTMGLLPITGMTLPLVSYGGSSLVVNGAALGLLVNVGQRRPMLLSRRPFEHKQDTRPAPYRPLESSNAGKMASTERTP